jgi:hypothetical protein
MPILKKVFRVGGSQGQDSRGIVLPKDWLEWIERETGQPLKEVLIEIGRNLVIIPYIEGKPIAGEVKKHEQCEERQH